MDYETFRHAADSWGLVYLVVVFLGAVAYAYRPGGKKAADEAARIPLDED